MTTKIITDNTTGGDYTGTDSAMFAEVAPTTNFGTDTHVQAWGLGGGTNRTTALKFTGLSNIAGPVTVTSATLSLYKENSNPGTFELYRLLRNWVEAEATWNIYSTGNSWTTPGGTGSATDIAATASYSAAENAATGAYVDFTSAQLAADVEGFINGTLSNFGWLTFTPTVIDYTYSSEDQTDAQRPKLTVVYTASGSSPTLMGQVCC